MQSKEIAEWPKEDLKDRLHKCRRLLFFHGHITAYYNTVLKSRIDKAPEIKDADTKLA